MNTTADQDEMVAEVRSAALERLKDLERILDAHGFSVEVETKFWTVTATMPPGLEGSRSSRVVQLAPDDAGRFYWYWKCDRHREVEPMAPGESVAHVAVMIAQVLERAARR